MAACCSKLEMIWVMEILYTLRAILHYDFNGEKSGILVFGESRKGHLISSADRSFCCGFDKVAVGKIR